MEDRREQILQIMNLFLVREQRSKEKVAKFKAKAYVNAINAINEYGKPITTIEDVNQLQGIGDKIRRKMYEIVETGDLEEAKGLVAVEEVRSELLDIYGIGPVKADELIKVYGIRSLDDLVKLVYLNREILTDAQTLGLIYYEDFKKRIPREEIVEFEKILKRFYRKTLPGFELTIVGSYRRGLASSGDIDVLMTYSGMSHDEAMMRFEESLVELNKLDIIIGTLAQGKTKFLGIAQVHTTARRLDILLTPPEELACAMLYFTGSKEFNVNFRKVAIMRGYTLNEKTMEKLVSTLPIPDPPEFKTEKDVFDFLGIKYQSPEERVGPIELS